MNNITIAVSKKYDILAGTKLLDSCGELISERVNPCTAAVITDSNVDALYGDTVVASLGRAGFDTFKYAFPAGEEHKTIATYTDILNFLAENRLTRSDLVVALGGGVTGDMAGFAAATYMRGIPFVQIPTTFLAAVDSSVGGKTAVDLPTGKNLAGAFWQPELVICDCDTFDTLPDTVFADGIAESLKHGLISDGDFFQSLASGNIRDNIASVVSRNVEIKASFVTADEFETGVRKLLNFGHTIGHAVEKCSDYGISHGHAVAIGMVCALRGAEKTGLCNKAFLLTVIAALAKNGLPTKCPYIADEIYNAALGDKKRAGASISIVYLEDIGRAAIKRLSLDELRKFIEFALEE